MSQKAPSHYQIIYSQEQILTRVQELAQEIGSWAESRRTKTGRQVLAVCILRGGIYFFADLLRKLDTSVEPTFCRTWSYSSTTNIQGAKGVRVSVDDVVAQGHSILMVDDICDSGSTLRKLANVFLELGASEVESVVLIRRKVEKPNYSPTWTGFEFDGSTWFVGYGMEDKNHFSNLAGVYGTEPG